MSTLLQVAVRCHNDIPSAAMAARIGFLRFMETMRLKSLMKPHRLTRKWIGEIFRQSVLSAMIYYTSNVNILTLAGLVLSNTNTT